MGRIRHRELEHLLQNVEWLRGLVVDSPVNQAILAELLDVTPATMSRYFSNGKISAENIMVICNKFSVSPPQWMQFDEPGLRSEIRDNLGEYHPLPKPLAVIMNYHQAGLLTKDDLVFLEQMAGRLAGKNQAIKATKEKEK